MRSYICILLMVFLGLGSAAQVPYNAGLPNGYTKKAIVSEQVGLSMVSISYYRPAVNKRDGKIWGQIVPVGFINQGFGNGKLTPWRAGANENTVIEFTDDVKIEGKLLTKGKYGLFIAYDPVESTIIFSKKSDGWGSFFYDQKEDALRVKVKPEVLDSSVEFLKYEFTTQTPGSSMISLSWEKMAISFKVEVDFLKQQYEALLAESQNPRGFTSQGLNIAANWSLQNNYQFEKGLEWANMATGTAFPGDPTSFSALTTKALLLLKLNRADQASIVVKNALSYANSAQLLQFGRQMISAKNLTLAEEIFVYNFEKNPGQFPALVGMARGNSAKAAYAKATEFATQALAVAPNAVSKQAVEAMLTSLKAGKDIN